MGDYSCNNKAHIQSSVTIENRIYVFSAHSLSNGLCSRLCLLNCQVHLYQCPLHISYGLLLYI